MDPLLYPTVLSIMIQGIIGIISQIQHSRCTEINTCCISCRRDVPQEQPDNTKPLLESQESHEQ